ncbi:MAG: undecaprenyl-phosphate glucose phosphotransferase [Treponemataceae bacterium]
MFKEQSDPFRFTLMFLDFVVSVLSFSIAFYIRFFVLYAHNFDFRTIAAKDYTFLAAVLSINQVISMILVNAYHPRRTQSFVDEVGTLFAGIALNLVTSLSFVFFMQTQDLSRFTVILFAIVNFVMIVFAHSAARNVLRARRRLGKNVKPVVILGTGHSARRIAKSLERDPMFGYRILGFVSGDPQTNESIPGFNVLGHLDGLAKIIHDSGTRLVVSALENAGPSTIAQVLETCDSAGVSLKLVPGFSEFVAIHGRIESIDGLPVVSVRDIPAREGLNRILKRTFDLFFSTIFILVFSPIFLLSSLLIKLTSKGPVFFAQERVGLDGKSFKMLKFRTMRVQATEKSSTVWTTKDDPRVTPLGKFLRKTSIDEIPQFFNVLSGRMSVVGPRPERPFYVEQFSTKYNFYMRRHAMKSGITGWAQINGLRGDTSIEERALADIYYIENWSFWLDIKIVALTPFKGLVNKNAY